MIFSTTKFLTTFGLAASSLTLLVGCHNTHSVMTPQNAQIQPPRQESSEIVKLRESAEQGNAAAQYQLGLMYDMGKNISQNYSKAFEWYEKSANQGLASAQSKLGSMYRHGKGVEINHTKASEWYWKAAEQGNEDAHYHLGSIYISNKNGLRY